MWIHEQSDWPDFSWDNAALTALLVGVRHQQGRLLGRMEGMGFALRQEAGLKTLTSDVVKSSAIEGEVLATAEVRSSIAQRLGLDIGGVVPASRDVEGIVDVMLDATQNYQQPLTEERLFAWHAALFPTGRSGLYPIVVGAWRPESVGAMRVVSGGFGREKIHFEAPQATRLAKEMPAFLEWFENETGLDSVLKAAIAHFWFVTLHPFEDGNGRIARAIADMALARADKTAFRFYSMSTQIEAERKKYYQELESQQRGSLSITLWLQWFLECLGRAIGNADALLSATIYKAKLWEHANSFPVNERQRLILNRLLDDFEGHMNTSKYSSLVKCSSDTALRDIQALLKWKLLVKNPGGGRSTSYRLAEVAELEL